MDIKSLWQKLDQIAEATDHKSIPESKKKKPDADGDGVPDWADKNPGKDDNEDKKKVEEGTGKQVDMKGKKCTSCNKGTYQETDQHDDMDGVLHCTKCNKEVKRHQSDNSKKKSVAEGRGFRGVGGAREREDDERHDLDPSDWYIVKDGKLLKASIYPRQEAQARAEGFSPTREEARAKASNKGVAEASPRQHPKRYQRAIDSFNRFMDEPESTPKDDLQSRHDQTKNRIKTNTMAGPKGQLPEAGKDVMRHSGDTTVKIVKRRGVPVGEIGIDAEASPGNGQYYVKLYDGSYDAVGFDTAKEALEELKYAISSSMEEDAASDDPLLAKSVDLAPVGALEENAELRLILQRAKLIE